MDEKVMEHSTTRTLESFTSSVNEEIDEVETTEISDDVQTSEIIDEYGVGIDTHSRFIQVCILIKVTDSII